MQGFAADLRYAVRSLRLAPAFFALVIGILALGIGASVSVYTIVDGVLLRPLPYADAHRLVALTSVAADPKFDSNGAIGYSDFEQFRAHCRSFSDVVVTYRRGWSAVTLTGGAEPERAQGAFVSSNFFALFGRSPVLGRTFTEDENHRAERVALISEGLAIRRFGSAAQALQQDIELSGIRWKVIGIMPGDFQVPFLDTQLWAPVLSHPEWDAPGESNPRLRQRWDVIARLNPATPLAHAQAEVDSVEGRLRAETPEFHQENVRLVPLRDHFTGSVRRPLLILLAAVAFLLLLACTNVGNLLLSRVAVRQREFAVRAALGAGRGRLLRQALVETGLVALLGGAAGTVLAVFLVPVLKAAAPAGIPRLLETDIDARVLAFAAAISCSLALLLGIVPAWNASRRDIARDFQGLGRTSAGTRRTRRWKGLLVVTQFTLAIVLMSGAALLVRSLAAVLHIDPGFRPEHVLTLRVALPNLTSPPRITRFYSEVIERIAALPDVQSAGAVSNLFFLDEKRTHALGQVEGRPPELRSSWKPLVWTQVSGDYFQAMGISLLRGRYFDVHDRPDAPPVVVVNEALASRYWPGGNPVGRRVKGFDPRGKNDDWLTVVGVVKGTRSGGIERAPFSQIYELQSQHGEQVNNIVVRTAGDPARIAGSARALVRSVNPAATISGIQTMERLLDEQTASRRFLTWLIVVFSSIALALAALGVFALMHYHVASRQREIGIRIAVGATGSDIFRKVVWDGARLAIIGAAAGLVCAAWTTGALASMLFEVKPGDPLSFGISLAILIGVAIAASCLPARRALRVDPMTVLRQE